MLDRGIVGDDLRVGAISSQVANVVGSGLSRLGRAGGQSFRLEDASLLGRNRLLARTTWNPQRRVIRQRRCGW